MSRNYIFIADGKLYTHRGENDIEIRSRVLDSYIERLADSARRNEWKNNGKGAAFMGARAGGQTAEETVAAVRSLVSAAVKDRGSLVYALNISGQTGIYRIAPDGTDGGIVLASGTEAYSDFDILDGKMTYSAAFAGYSHIGSMTVDTSDSRLWTDGDSWDFSPVWSRSEKNRIYFCSAGLKISGQEENTSPKSYADMYRMIYEAEAASVRGPSSICLLDIEKGTLDTVLEDPDFDFVHPQSLPDGSLWYIKRPYTDKSTRTNPFGCLLDILLLPFRLVLALFGLFTVFSMKYSGQPLDRSVKRKDEKQTFIDGNLINAEEEMRKNAKHGEKNPGIIPHSWELHRRLPDGSDETVRCGVSAYRAEADGSLLFSNGLSVIERTTDNGKVTETKVSSAKHVSYII